MNPVQSFAGQDAQSRTLRLREWSNQPDKFSQLPETPKNSRKCGGAPRYSLEIRDWGYIPEYEAREWARIQRMDGWESQ